MREKQPKFSEQGNTGDWSELYALLKLMVEGKVYAADENLDPVSSACYTVTKIIRPQVHPVWVYERIEQGDDFRVNILNLDTQKTVDTVPGSEFIKNTKVLLTEMKRKKTKEEKGAYSIPQMNAFRKRIKANTIKASSIDKADLFIETTDYKTNFQSTFGFSVKSRVGGPPSLLNSSKTTNFTYEIVGNMHDSLMSYFNNICTVNAKVDLKSRFEFFRLSGLELKFLDISKPEFKTNLIFIDRDLVQICGYMLADYYTENRNPINESLNYISSHNPLNYENLNKQPVYQYKFKKLVTASACGMMPSKPWSGDDDVNGGYLIVKRSGEVVCYPANDRVKFEDYLMNNIRFERPSTSKHEFGTIYKNRGKYFIELNMQIRFLK